MARCFAAVALVCLFRGELRGAEWGDLTMRFIYDGAPPEAKPIAAAAAAAGCGKGPHVEEQLVVDPKDRGIANVAVWLLRTTGSPAPAVHESYAKTALDKVTMTNINCRFEPRVLVVRTTQTFVGVNADPTGHNMKGSFFENPEFNETIPPGGQLTKSLKSPEAAPSAVACGIHPWMGGYLLVRDDPYAAVSDAHGKLKIANLPAGNWTFVVWHEKSGYIKSATRGMEAVSWMRGRMTLDVKPGNNDLGDFKIRP